MRDRTDSVPPRGTHRKDRPMNPIRPIPPSSEQLDAQARPSRNCSAWRRTISDGAYRQAIALGDGLFPHQIEGVAFLLGRRRAILADDMGLGKTRQAIVSLRHASPGGPYLVVCPASVKRNWAREIRARSPRRLRPHRRRQRPRACRRFGMDGRELRHPVETHRRARARAVGGHRVRRSALPEEPHERAQPSRAAARGTRSRDRRRKSRPCTCSPARR